MELTVLNRHGIAEDTILSIRAGAVKRQAPVTSARPFRFPKMTMEDNPLRVAILQQVTSAFLVLKPSGGQYQVIFDSGATCEVAVKKVADGGLGDPKRATAEFGDKKDTVASATEAKDYLDRHNILEYVQALLQALIKERPEDPFAFIAKHCMSGYAQPGPGAAQKPEASPAAQEATLREAPKLQQEPSRQVVPPEAPRPAGSPPRGAPVAAPGAAEGMEARTAAPEAQPLEATARASREPVVAAPDIEALRSQVQSTLVKANADGTLTETLDVVRREMQVCEAPAQDVARSPAVDVATMKQKIRETLLEAGQDGTLRQLLTGAMKASRDKDSSAEKVQAQEACSSAQQTLLQATSSGRLAAVLREVAGTSAKASPSAEAVRDRTRDTLAQAASDGSLAASIQALLSSHAGAQEKAVSSGQSVTETCQRVSTALGQAAQDGCAAAAMGQLRGESAEATCKVLGSTLLKAFQDGTLAPALREVAGAG